MRLVDGSPFVWFDLLPYAYSLFSRWFVMKEDTPIKNGEEKLGTWLSERSHSE